MSLRNMTVQYVGDTLYLPPLEREVNNIIVRNEDVKDWEHFEKKRADDYKQAAEYWQRMYEESFTERTCEFVNSRGSDYPPVCSACGYKLGIYDCAWYEDGTYGYEQNYCPNCGAKVVSE